MNNTVKQDKNINIVLSPKDFFSDAVEEALKSRKIKADIYTKNYLVELLGFYLNAQNLFEKEKVDESGKRKPQTFAEAYLTAVNAEWTQKIELLKKLGDRALYICGFFGDSLERKIVDIDYYAEIGGSAYSTLSSTLEKNDPLRPVYSTFSYRFFDFVEALTHISQKSMVSNNQSLLRLYDKYLQTGSEIAKEKLLEMGIVTLPVDQKKQLKQN